MTITFMSAILQNLWFRVFSLLLLFVFAYWIPIRGIVNTWLSNDDYSYGFLIPVISIYLIWEKRAILKGTEIKGLWKMFPVLIFFVLLSIYAVLGSSGNISRPLVPILIILFTLFCFGFDLVKKLILPLGFLIFMVPLPAILDRTFGVFLKSISSKLGGEIIRLSGMTVHVSGNVIDLGVTQLQVVDACSGLRFLFPLFAIGVVYAYFFERAVWKKIFCVLSTIPIAIFTNVLRIGITGILTNIYGVEVAEGFFHGFSGWAIFMVAFAFLFLLGRLLSFFPPKIPLRERKPKGSDLREPRGIIDGISKWTFVVSLIMLLIVGALSWNTGALPPVKVRGGIQSFPLSFDDWQGRPQIVDPEIILASGAEEAFSGQYRNSKSEIVSLYMGYRATAFLENENFFHSPTVCLPSSGWKTKSKLTYKINDIPLFGTLPVTKMIIESAGQRQLVYFWFQTKDTATHDKNINRFHLALHAIKKDNTHDLFIRPITPIKKNESIEEAENRLNRFIRDMMEALFAFLQERQINSR